MAGIHRERPGAGDLSAATDTPALALGDGVWMSPGVSNAYAVATDEGRVIVNSGLVFEGPLHARLLPRCRARHGPSSSPRGTRTIGAG